MIERDRPVGGVGKRARRVDEVVAVVVVVVVVVVVAVTGTATLPISPYDCDDGYGDGDDGGGDGTTVLMICAFWGNEALVNGRNHVSRP